MKRVLLFTLCACLLLCLTACGGGDKHIDVSMTESGAESDVSSIPASSEAEVSSKVTETVTSAVTECNHKYTSATCTTAEKCSVCGEKRGKALGHAFKSGTCERCGAKDGNYATYKNGGKDSIIRTTATGKKTTLKIDISSAQKRVDDGKEFGTNMTLTIERKHFYEADGWLYFVQSNIYEFAGNKSESYEVFRIKTDGSKQTQIKTTVVTDDKGVAVAGVFGFADGKLFYSVENADNGTYSIYSAKMSTSTTDLTSQGKKLEQADTGCFFENYKLKDGWLYYSLTKGVYNTETGKTDITDMGDYKIKLDGSGKKKVS